MTVVNNNEKNNIEFSLVSVFELKLDDFQSYKNSIESKFPKFDKTIVQYPKFLPTTAEALTHLKLLKAFSVMKNKVIGDENNTDYYQINQWKSFITVAVRRFIIFVSALKALYINEFGDANNKSFEDLNKTKGFENIMANLLPPLDVIMVWHAFLLNPKSFFDTFSRNSFIDFAKYPLPLDRIYSCINNETFEFSVPESYEKNYINVLKKFINNNDTDFIYEIKNFSMYQHLVIINCPNCKNTISDPIPLVTDSCTGFADSEFITKKKYQQGYCFDSSHCYCSKIEDLTHEQLRKLQLFCDINSSKSLPGIEKYLSNTLTNPKFAKRNTISINQIIKLGVQKSWEYADSSISDIITRAAIDNGRSGRIIKVILREYLQFNLIHLTVPNAISIGEDLVGCVLRQESFVKKMNAINWLGSSTVLENLNTARVRYQRFFLMLTDAKLKKMLVPTLDIDLIWHTHQLWMYGYFHDCLNSPCHSAIDHDDKVDEGKLDDGFEFTSKIYKRKYKEDYSICYCQYCSEIRVTKMEKVMKLFKSKKSGDNPIGIKEETTSNVKLLTLENPSHISTHNSIQLPTKKAEKRRSKNPVPWRNTGSDAGFFVVPPVTPVPIDDSKFYGDGLCCSVAASCATTNGTCCQISGGACGGGSTGCGGGGCGGGGGGGCGGGGCGGGGGGC